MITSPNNIETGLVLLLLAFSTKGAGKAEAKPIGK